MICFCSEWGGEDELCPNEGCGEYERQGFCKMVLTSVGYDRKGKGRGDFSSWEVEGQPHLQTCDPDVE